MKLLFLSGNDNLEYIKHRNLVCFIDAETIFRTDKLLARAIRRLSLSAPFWMRRLILKYSLNSWVRRAHVYDLIILSGSVYSLAIGEFLISKGLGSRVVHWYWNPIPNSQSIAKLKQSRIPIYSFDPADCSRYRLDFFYPYYFMSMVNTSPRDHIYDVYFVGGDKGRLADLLAIRKLLIENGYSTKFVITDTGPSTDRGSYKYDAPISYTQVLEDIANSGCILDWLQKGQSGLTQRPLEALFHRKKLITNDVSIVGQDFYLEENIFVFGFHDINNLYLFMESPYVPLSESIVAKYDFRNWARCLYGDSLYKYGSDNRSRNIETSVL